METLSMQFAKHVKWRTEKFGAVIFDTLTEKVYVTSETGKDILPLIDEGLSIPEMAARLGDEFEADPAQIESDVAEFVAGLQEGEMIEQPSEGGAQ